MFPEANVPWSFIFYDRPYLNLYNFCGVLCDSKKDLGQGYDEALLTLRLNCQPQGHPEKKEGLQGKKSLRVKNALSNPEHLR